MALTGVSLPPSLILLLRLATAGGSRGGAT
jgi:hypothetical protein